MLSSIANKFQNGLFSRNSGFIKRWPTNPKIAFFGPPNVFLNEISLRMAVDLGVPVLSAQELLKETALKFETDPNFNDPFY